LKNSSESEACCGGAGNGRRFCGGEQDAEAFAAEVVEVTEQVVESETAEPVAVEARPV
jgi:hypothetical protein